MTLHTGDCLDVMPTLAAGSVDAIVTDPPYGLEFMGKAWDKLGDVGKTSHAGPAERDGSNPYGRTRVSFFGSSNQRCRNCGKWKWGHTTGDGGGGGKKCECDAPDFPPIERRQGLAMQEWHARWAVEALRVARPGAYLLAFGGTRTVHRMTCAIEDAGWVIRDVLVWAYAQGFPKSRASLKPAWEPIVMARKPGASTPLQIDAARIGLRDERPLNRNGPIGYGGSEAQGAVIDGGLGRWPANVVLTDPIFDGDVPGVVGGGYTSSPATYYRQTSADSGIYGQGLGTNGVGDEMPGYGDTGTYSRFFLIPKADRAEREPIWGSGLEAVDDDPDGSFGLDAARPHTSPDYRYQRKARLNGHPTVKPLDLMRHLVRLVTPSRVPCLVCDRCGAVVEYAHGEASSITNAMPGVRRSDLDGSRKPDSVLLAGMQRREHGQESLELPWVGSQSEGLHLGAGSEAPDGEPRGLPDAAPSGRRRDSGPDADADRGRGSHQRGEVGQPPREPTGHGEAGARQFAEASEEADRLPPLRRHDHPLGSDSACDGGLVPAERPGRVLDPFLGSGTTAIACEMEGFPWIGIEREPEYVAIAEARLMGVQRGMGLDVPAPTPEWEATATHYPVKGPSQSSWFADSTRETEPAP